MIKQTNFPVKVSQVSQAEVHQRSHWELVEIELNIANFNVTRLVLGLLLVFSVGVGQQGPEEQLIPAVVDELVRDGDVEEQVQVHQGSGRIRVFIAVGSPQDGFIMDWVYLQGALYVSK